MLRAVQVLAVHQRQELGVLQVVVPGEAHQPLQRRARLQMVEIQLLLGGADVDIGLFQDGLEQPLLAFEVVVDHALVGFRLLGDHVDPRAAQPVLREFALCRRQDARLGRLGIPHPGLFCR